MASSASTINRIITMAAIVFSISTVYGQSLPFDNLIQCEKFSARQGGYYPNPPVYGEPRTAVKWLGAGDWLRFDSINFMGGEYDSVVFYYVGWGSDWSTDGHIARLRLDNPTGTELAVYSLTNTNNGAARPVRAPLPEITGFHTLYLTFEGGDTVCWVADKIDLIGHASIGPNDAQTYYVAPYGNDGNSGVTLDKPFKTIQKAASVMKPGSVCNIRQGVYRETVRPYFTGLSAGAGLTFQAYNNEQVFISGADSLTGWTQHSGSIYKTRMPWSLGTYKNQLLIDGRSAVVARSPNIDDPHWASVARGQEDNYPCGNFDGLPWQKSGEIDPFMVPQRLFGYSVGDDALKAQGLFKWGVQSWPSQDWIPQSWLNLSTDCFKGGLLTCQNSWWVNTSKITSSYSVSNSDVKGTYITGRIINQGAFTGSDGMSFVSYLLPLLDSPNEWYRDSSTGTVYLWAPDGGDPSHHLVEGKSRMLGFDLTNKKHVTLKGIRFLCTSATLENAQQCTIDDCHFKYASYYDAYDFWEEFAGCCWYLSAYDPSDGATGVFIGGDYNTVKNSSCVVSAGSGFILSGRGHHTVTNCIIHDVNWLPTYSAGVRVLKRDQIVTEDNGGNLIQYNTIYNCGRSTIEAEFVPKEEPLRILNNDLGRCGWLANEVTSVGLHYANSVEVAYNRFHSVGGHTRGYLGADATWGCYGIKIHHNVFYKGKNVFSLSRPDMKVAWHWVVNFGDIWLRIYNNTVIDSALTPGFDTIPLTRNPDWDTTGGKGFPPECSGNNLLAYLSPTDWKFNAPANNDFTLKVGSPAINAGAMSPGYTDNVTDGKPDLGAYEFGQPAWRAGADWTEKPWVYPPSAIAQGVMSGLGRNARPMFPQARIMPGKILLRGIDGMPYKVMLVNVLGRTVVSMHKPKGGVAVLSTQALASGAYVMRILCAGKAISTKALVTGM